MSDIQGHCDPRFERVRDILQTNFDDGIEVGASLYVTIGGEPVIDLWGGWRDEEHSAPWSSDTIVNVFSATKTVTSLAALMLVDRGLLDPSAPVADYWPEFAAAGKETVEVRHLLSHTVGLPAWEPPFSMAEALDIAASTSRLAGQATWWEPGSRGSYHASTFGHLNAELVRRVTGAPISRFIAREIAEPLDADVYVGLDDAMFGRVATVYPVDRPEGGPPKPAQSADPVDGLSEERAIYARTRAGSFSGQKRDSFALFNSAEWRRSEIAGSSGHANARGLGRVMSVLSNGGRQNGHRFLSPETIALIFQEQFRGTDAYYLKPIRWGIGYALAPLHEKERGPLPFLRPGPRTCYWYGTGGSLAIADVERGISIGYAMNKCRAGRDAQNGRYYNAIYDALAD